MHGVVAGSVAAGDWCEPFDEGQPAFERNIFAENHEAAFAIAVGEFAVWIDEKTGVKIIGRGGSGFGIVGADEPDVDEQIAEHIEAKWEADRA